LKSEFGASASLLTQSATAGLELACLLTGIGPGDEVVLPSFTFVSCANAIALRGATPVFADVDARTLNLDPVAVEAAITPATRAIMVVHYAGVPCAMDEINALARRLGVWVIEDAAQAFLSQYRGRPVGTLGDLAVFSFHGTKNVTCGEGGALLVNVPGLVGEADIAHRNGTDKTAFEGGQRALYTWIGLGSSFAPSEISAAVLLAQLERARSITEQRRVLWERYHQAFAAAERAGRVRRPVVPDDTVHNGHLYYLLMPSERARDNFISGMRGAGIVTPFHFVPLHASPGGRRYGRTAHDDRLPRTEEAAGRLVRLPLWHGVADVQDRVIETALDLLERL
jgi:dTDP-4-amino-4,6-dideoxygalactose transaminase